jgi:hypothetical protein
VQSKVAKLASDRTENNRRRVQTTSGWTQYSCGHHGRKNANPDQNNAHKKGRADMAYESLALWSRSDKRVKSILQAGQPDKWAPRRIQSFGTLRFGRERTFLLIFHWRCC